MAHESQERKISQEYEAMKHGEVYENKDGVEYKWCRVCGLGVISDFWFRHVMNSEEHKSR